MARCGPCSPRTATLAPLRSREPAGQGLPAVRRARSARPSTQASSTGSAVSEYVELVPTAGGGAAVAVGGDSTSGGGRRLRARRGRRRSDSGRERSRRARRRASRAGGRARLAAVAAAAVAAAPETARAVGAVPRGGGRLERSLSRPAPHSALALRGRLRRRRLLAPEPEHDRDCRLVDDPRRTRPRRLAAAARPARGDRRGRAARAFACWDLASTAWAPSAENAVSEFDRSALYLGVYVLVVVTSAPAGLLRWLDGLAPGSLAIGVIALVSRLFPRLVPGAWASPSSCPTSSTRLSFPLGYWNGLAIFVALAFPLLLFWIARPAAVSAGLAAAATLPAIGAVVYLTSSRGAPRGARVRRRRLRRRAAAPLGPPSSPSPRPGPVALAVRGARLAARCSSTARSGRRRRASEGRRPRSPSSLLCLRGPRRRRGRGRASRRGCSARRGRSAWPSRVFVLVVCPRPRSGTRAARFDTSAGCRDGPAASVQGNAVSDHLLSGSGSGRWQFWTAVAPRVRARPARGGAAPDRSRRGGPGTRPFRYFVKDAHSLFLQTLGELGIVGFAF